MNLKKIKPYAIVAAFVITLLFGSGAVYNHWQSINNQKLIASQNSQAIIDIYEKINILETNIADAATKYFQKEKNNKTKYLLISAINTYNRTEAKLSEMESRSPRFFNPQQLFPKDEQNIQSSRLRVSQFDKYTFIQISNGRPNDEILDEVDKVVKSIIDSYDQQFQHRFFKNECNVGSAKKCTDLAVSQSGYPQNRGFSRSDIELLRKGCGGGDSFGCEILFFHYYFALDYERALIVGEKACDFSVGRACGALGTMYAASELKNLTDYDKARMNLSKACLLKNAKSCYIRAYLQISGHIEKDSSLAKKFLNRGCHLGHELSCIAENRYSDFSVCGNKEFEEEVNETSAKFSLSCLEV